MKWDGLGAWNFPSDDPKEITVQYGISPCGASHTEWMGLQPDGHHRELNKAGLFEAFARITKEPLVHLIKRMELLPAPIKIGLFYTIEDAILACEWHAHDACLTDAPASLRPVPVSAPIIDSGPQDFSEYGTEEDEDV